MTTNEMQAKIQGYSWYNFVDARGFSMYLLSARLTGTQLAEAKPALEALGWNTQSIIWSVSCDRPREKSAMEIYSEKSEQEQMEMDFSILEIGGFLHDWQMERLKSHGLIKSDSW